MPALPHATPAEIDLDAAQLERVYGRLREWTEGPEATIPGAAVVVGRRGRIVEPRFFGRQGPEKDAPRIRRDGVFLLASITKPVTYIAALRLMERGRLDLSDPVMRHLPDFAAQHKEDTLLLHLFTHTSGMPDMLPDNVELRRQHAPLERFVEGALAVAPLFRPGTDYRYQSMGTLVVAELVRRLSGKSIHDYVRDEILGPLKMDSSSLGLGALDRERVVRVQEPEYQAGSDFGWNSLYWQKFGAPWGGMFASPEDLAVLCQTLLDGGARGGERLLSPATVEAMTTNRFDDLPELPEKIRRCRPWGLGWQLNPRGTADSWGGALGADAYGHTGATGTLCWIDPRREGFCILLTTRPRSHAPWQLVQLSNMCAAAFV